VKTDKATHSNDERTAVIELEQAGDSAKAAAEADIGVADTRAKWCWTRILPSALPKPS
jgi:hypothetical protein